MSKRIKDFKIVKIDTGFCQITYVTRNEDNQRIFYALQDNGKNHGGIRLMRCTTEYEPQWEAKLLKPGIGNQFEIPTGDSELENLARDWIVKQSSERDEE